MVENRIIHIDAPEVQKAVESAARAACSELDLLFPGSDNGGISSNFEGLLNEVISHMLKGESLLDRARGHQTFLPRLAVDSSFFGDPRQSGTTFALVRSVRLDRQPGDRAEVVREGNVGVEANGNPVGLDKLCTVYNSFEDAAQGGVSILRESDYTVETAMYYNLRVESVEAATAPATGYVLTKEPVAF